MRPTLIRTARRALVAAVAVSGLTACSLVGTGDGDDSSNAGPSGSTSSPGSPAGGGEVVLVTHDSFALPRALVQQFEAESGYDLVVRRSGDAGELTTKLALTADDPTGDVALGVDNTFAQRALASTSSPRTDVALPPGAERLHRPRRGGPAAPRRPRRRLRQRRHHLVPRPRPRAAGRPRRPRPTRRTAASSSRPRPSPARPAWPSCSAPSPSTATTGRATGRT